MVLSSGTTETTGHELFSDLLRQYVDREGRVDYQGLKSKSRQLDEYLAILRNNPPEASWNRNRQLAYWINAYNAFTIRLILDHYPVGSITDIDKGKPWDTQWIRLGGNTYSLNEIEHEIIRPQFNDPRIHFAVNCAARSCPPLANEAFTEKNLDSLLEQRTSEFINNPSFNILKPAEASVSKIFEWYAGDFGDLVIFLNKYAKTKLNAGARISFKEYDWKLNEG